MCGHIIGGKMDILKWLEKWYFSMCDGSWEHFYGVKIDTLDNPGWIVLIDIVDTPQESKDFKIVDRYINDGDWILCRIKDGKFEGGGDPTKLTEILQIFKEWVES